MICYFGHHRSGSSYIRSVLESFGFLSGRIVHTIHNLEEYEPDLTPSILIASNSNKQHVNTIAFNKAFHVIRDPRDVIVSSYYSHLLSHKTDVWKELSGHREQLKGLSKEQGLIFEIEVCRKQQFIDMFEWEYDNDHVLEIRFESFIQDLYSSWRDIFDFLEVKLTTQNSLIKSRVFEFNNRIVRRLNKMSPTVGFNSLYWRQNPSVDQLDHIIRDRDFNQKTGRKPGSEDINHHYRKGIAGDWKNHFSPEVKDCFKNNWGELLIKLQYEKDLNW